MRRPSSANPAIHFTGDSFVGGTKFTRPWGREEDLNTAIGGSSIYEQRAALSANIGYLAYPTIWVDGGPQGYRDVDTYTATLSEIIAGFGGTPVAIGIPFPRENLNRIVNEDLRRIREYMMERHPFNFIDYEEVPEIVGEGRGKAVPLAPNSSPSFHDGVHLVQSASDAYERHARLVLASLGRLRA